MTEEQIKKRIKHLDAAIDLLDEEFDRMYRESYLLTRELKKLDDLVVFCQSGKYPT